jgi:LysM repeat protein
MIISPVFEDVGAGIATSNNTSYFVLVAGKSTGGTPVAYTPPASLRTATVTFIPNTPNANGSITYIVQPGDTTLGIAINYGISLQELLNLNNLSEKSIIYAGNKLIIRSAYTATPTQPTPTLTELPTITNWPTSTQVETDTSIPPTPTPTPALPISAAGEAVAIIIVAALLIAGLITLLGRRPQKR